MHLYLISRGIKHDVDRFITELQGKYLPFKYPDKDGNMKDVMVQVGVRPIQLWEVVFPEEHKDMMLNTLFQSNPQGATQHKKHNKFIFAIRKILGVDPIPEYKKDQVMPIYLRNTELSAIGIKKDYWRNFKTGEAINDPTEEQKKEFFEAL